MKLCYLTRKQCAVCVDGGRSYQSNWSAVKKKICIWYLLFLFYYYYFNQKKSTLRMTFYLDKANTTSVSN